MEEKYILSLDIGTTTIRSFIFNTKAEIVGKAADQVVLHYPQPGFVEIDPDELWNTVVVIVEKSLQNASLSAGQMTAMGITTQRGTFLTWSRETGKPFHKFVTWKDMRANKLVQQWNESYTWKMIKAGSYALYLVLRSKRFRAGSVLKFMNSQTTLRLCWTLANVPALQHAVQSNDAMFGTLDTWLLYKLTGGKVHMTDVSSASATGFYDPFTMQWAGWALTLFKIPANALPVVVDNAGDHFTSTIPSIWGHAIPIRSCMADQTASMWGSCCFDVGDVKLTMGTGTFFNINTGRSPHASVSGFYPIVGWRNGSELVYSAEGANHDTASIIKWAQSIGLFDKPEDTADIAASVPDSDGVFFVPAFSGLGPPYNDGAAAAGFVGLKPSTTKAHLVRAVLEALSFCMAQLYVCACKETHFNFSSIRLDGGVSNNDFIGQLLADLTGLRVERPRNVDMSALGCALSVGLHLGVWNSKKELKMLREIDREFTPRSNVRQSYEPVMRRWEDAVTRLSGWYNPKASLRSLSEVSNSSSSATQDSYKVTKKNGSISK